MPERTEIESVTTEIQLEKWLSIIRDYQGAPLPDNPRTSATLDLLFQIPPLLREIMRLLAPFLSEHKLQVTREHKPRANDQVSIPRRLAATVTSARAARRVEAYIHEKGISASHFAGQCFMCERTLRSFRKTGKVRRDIFRRMAEVMGITPEELMK